MQKKNDLSLIWLFILFAWLLDVLTSMLGIALNIMEGSAFFLVYPSMWLAIFWALSSFVYFFRWAPVKLRKIILLGIVLGSFIPAINNLIVMYVMVIA